MDNHPYLNAVEVDRSSLRTRLAQEMIATIEAENSSFILLISIKRFETEKRSGDILEVQLEPAVPTYPVHSIAAREQMMFFLPDDSKKPPEVYALRKDFPHVPHLTLLPWENPYN